MTSYDTKAAAERIGTTPKKLRQFLRSDPTFRNAGAGGKYAFSDADLVVLEKRFNAKAPAAEAKARTPRRQVKDTDFILTTDQLHRGLTRSERERRDAASRERVDRLEARLRAAGLHLSQMTRFNRTDSEVSA
jgi:hypothetical protein